MLKIINPATGEVIKDVETDTAASIEAKFKRARAQQLQWQATPLSERLQKMSLFRQILEIDKEELAQILTSEVGKPVSQSRNEIQGTLKRIDFFIEKTANVLKNETVFADRAGHIEEVISWEPLGVIANISAWNFPYFVGGNVFVPALLTGNCVLYKPSEFSTLTGLAIAERLHRAGFPQDSFIPVIGEGRIGAELLNLPVSGVFFTGSYPTGKKIAEAVAGRMIKTQLELGGKDPVYVCEDVDVKAAAEGLADGAFYNNGQSCCSVERIYVHAKIYDDFVREFEKTAREFVIGDPLNDKTYIGALTREAQLRVLQDQVADAVAKGAKLLMGGKRVENRPGNFFQPTVLTEVNHTMAVMRDESFGPIIGIQRVSGDEEALQLMNDTAYGLTSGVYSKSKERALAILAKAQSGSVYWNCCDRVSPNLPWSGRGFSGVGTTLSTYGILTFVQPKAWHLRD